MHELEQLLMRNIFMLMYPVYMEVASFQGEEGAKKTFGWAYATEKEHFRLYNKAKEFVASNYFGVIYENL